MTVVVSIASPPGAITVREVSLCADGNVEFPPKETDVTRASPVPETTTAFPPWSGPDAGVSEVMVGGATSENWSKLPVRPVPPADVTVTSTVPGAATGVTAVIETSLVTVKLAAGAPPKLTPVAAVNPVPVITTDVPPDEGPVLAEMPVTRGAGTKPGANRRKAELPEL